MTMFALSTSEIANEGGFEDKLVAADDGLRCSSQVSRFRCMKTAGHDTAHEHRFDPPSDPPVAVVFTAIRW
jgi:hypothetical protein